MALSKDKERIEEIHEEIQKQVKEPQQSIIRNIPTGTLLLFGGGLILGLFFISNRDVDMNRVFFFIALVAALVVFISMNQKSNRLLTEQECKIELYHQLKFKQMHRLGEHKELPEGTIKIQAKGRLRFFSGNPFKRQIGFSVLTNEGFEHQYSAELQPYTGDIIGIYEGYFDPRDASDMAYLAPPELLAEKKWGEYGGRLRR